MKLLRWLDPRWLVLVNNALLLAWGLALFGLGWSGVDVSELIQLFDGMRLDLHKLVPVSSPTTA